MIKIFVVEDIFEVKDKGIALVGVTEDDFLSIKDDDVILLKQPELPDIETTILGFELMRNSWSPHKPRNMCILIPASVGIENIERKSEVWGSI